MLHNTYWASVCKLVSAGQSSSLQVLESTNYQDPADGNVECCRNDALVMIAM
jgi:hypothetical protein